jgi:hypothetical protein
VTVGRQLQWVEFSVDCAERIVPDVIRPQVSAGVDVDRLIEVLELARAAGLGVVEAGVVGRLSGRGALKKGRAEPGSWWAETRGSGGQVLRVDYRASLVDSLIALVNVTLAGKGPRRIPIEWVEGMGWGGSSAATRRATVVDTVVTDRGVDLELTGASTVSVPELMFFVNEAATRALNSTRTLVLQFAGDNASLICVLPGGLVLRPCGRRPAQLVGFGRDVESVDVDVDLSAFYGNPQQVIGLHPVFEADDRGPWTGHKPIASVCTAREIE